MFHLNVYITPILLSILTKALCDEALLVINDSHVKILTVNIYFLKASVRKLDAQDTQLISVSGKICYQNSVEMMIENCEKRYGKYNSQWIFLFSNKSILKSFYEKKTTITENGMSIKGIVVNNQTMFFNETEMDYLTPMFSVNKEIFGILENYTIDKEEDNVIIDLKYSSFNTDLIGHVTFYMAIAYFGLLSVAVIAWHVLACLYRQFVNAGPTMSIQKIFQSFLYLKIALAVLVLYYSKLCLGKLSIQDISEALMRIYLQTIIDTINSILCTVFWFILIMISYGWQVYREHLSRSELRKIVAAFILLYVIICFDQILDLLIFYTIYNFKPSDIKNILLHFVLCGICCWLCFKTRKVLRIRYTYAYNFSREFLSAIKLKMKMISIHMALVIFYCCIYISMILVNKILLKNVLTDQLRFMTMYYVDLLSLLLFLALYRPRRFPQYFFIFFDSLNNEDVNQETNEFNIWSFTVTKDDYRKMISSEESSFNLLFAETPVSKKEEREFHRNSSMPIIVVNPTFESEMVDLDKIIIGERK